MTSLYIPDYEPAPEEPASRLRCTRLELLSGLAATQPFTSGGPWLDPAAVALLYKVAQSGRIGRFERAGHEAAIGVLTEAQLLNGAGRLTEAGKHVARILDQPAAALSFSGSHLGQATELRVWMDQENALLLAGPSAGTLVREPEAAGRHLGMLQLKLIRLDELFPNLASWLGIAPSWNLPVSPSTLSVEVLNSRQLTPGPAPEGADEALAYAWSEPWFLWHLLMNPVSGEGVGYVNAGGAGHYRVVVEEDQATLTSIPSANVYRHLVDLVESVRFQRAPRFA
ncbi:hypothetical protein [Arthrobacter sp. zg-Y769]|uniref:hypothetical protein n=1 Tax=Arthrobacter sp. zg-Y769 TaxID=2894191 RepID=UPI001E63157E|nr:hypothetical protein [Arthrobacter sp. zg-Y769]MCC9206328.1 hypothetical protein [Arthrobacter sp. zg-Y769]